MLELLVVLQSHSVSNRQKDLTRYMHHDKAEISYRCIKSLINSIEWCIKKVPDSIKINLKIFDDHSDREFLDRLYRALDATTIDWDLEALSTRGIMPSILKCYEYGKDKGKDLVYFAQDDYLYFESAIWEMIDIYFQATRETGYEVCVYPFDDPYRYGIRPPLQHSMLLGAKRHWKTSYHTASCFMISHPSLIKNWDLFYEMGTHKINKYMEDETINRLFSERNHLLFTPIPSVALHSQSEIEKDPYINWRELWEKFEEGKI